MIVITSYNIHQAIAILHHQFTIYNNILHTIQALPDYEHAHEVVVTDTDNIVQSTKSLVREMGQEQLTELRTISKPSQELEDIFAAIIIIGSQS